MKLESPWKCPADHHAWAYLKQGYERGVDESQERILAIINDWDAMADPDYEGDGEAEFKAKYGRDTTDLILVIQAALKGE